MIAIRDAGPEDAPLLAALHGAAFPEDPWNPKAIGEILTMPTAFGRIAAADGTPLGFALALCVLPECEIVMLGVEPNSRRQGVGRALLADLASRAARLGAAALVLEAAEDNRAALALYRGAGFREVGRRPDYYARRGDGMRAAPVAALTMRLNRLPAVDSLLRRQT